MAYVIIPSALRTFTNHQAQVEVAGKDVGEVLSGLAQRFPELRRHIFTEQGKLRNFVNVFVGEEDIRYLQHETTTVRPTDLVSIVPAVAGGS